MFTFFNDLHIDLNVAIEKRENFDATDRETIFVQDIDFFDVAIDENSETISKKNSEKIEVIDDSTTNFDDVKDDEKDDEIIDRNDVKDFDSKTNEITNFDFFACRMRICS